MESMGERKIRLSGIVKTKRTALSWDPEFKPRVKDLEDYLSRTTGVNSVSNADLFMLCLAIGFDAGKMRDIPPRKSDAVRISYLKEHHLAIMKSVALAHSKDYTVLLDEDLVFDVVEKYAAGGLEILSVEMDNQIDFVSFLATLLYKSIKKVNS
jgi:hypothetical protein